MCIVVRKRTGAERGFTSPVRPAMVARQLAGPQTAAGHDETVRAPVGARFAVDRTVPAPVDRNAGRRVERRADDCWTFEIKYHLDQPSD